MSFKVGVGKSDFQALRKSDNYYVDKTDLIYELVEETDNQATLFTRPRRFGKWHEVTRERYCSHQDFAFTAKSVRTRIFSQEGIQPFAAGKLPMG